MLKHKHSGLTHFMRRKYDPQQVADILVRYDVSPRVGCLPPQLVHLVRAENRATVTREFGKCLEKFGVDNIKTLGNLRSDTTFGAPDISALFNTKCEIIARGINICGISPWSGGFGIVCKVSFPKIGAEYALKYFIESGKENGAWFEILTAFSANHSEPRDNCPVYMASLKSGYEFMLSKWAGDVCDGKIRENKYPIYSTSEDEQEARNWRGGRRIDYGETFQTDYGRLSYSERKLFRKIIYAAERGYDTAFEYMYSTMRCVNDRKNLDHIMDLAWISTFMTDQYRVMDVIERNIKRHLR